MFRRELMKGEMKLASKDIELGAAGGGGSPDMGGKMVAIRLLLLASVTAATKVLGTGKKIYLTFNPKRFL